MTTILTRDSNPAVRKTLSEPGAGRVLVVDAGASMRCAMVGDRLAEYAYKNGWAGVVVNGCVRDSDEIRKWVPGAGRLGGVGRRLGAGGWRRAGARARGSELPPAPACL